MKYNIHLLLENQIILLKICTVSIDEGSDTIQ